MHKGFGYATVVEILSRHLRRAGSQMLAAQRTGKRRLIITAIFLSPSIRSFYGRGRVQEDGRGYSAPDLRPCRAKSPARSAFIPRGKGYLAWLEREDKGVHQRGGRGVIAVRDELGWINTFPFEG